MKKTLTVNIGNVGFTIDEDAYQTLNGYYDDISSRLYEGERAEIMEDIETRTADIFRENLTYPSQVVSLGLVKRAIAIIGSSDDFGEKRYDHGQGSGTTASTASSPFTDLRLEGKLYRSRTDRLLSGVCGGLADYFKIDSTLVRVLMVLAFLLGSVGFWLYIILWIAVPQEPMKLWWDPTDNNPYNRYRKGGSL